MEFYPLYPFGYGLSYTQFEYANLQTTINADGTVDVQVAVRNTGTVAGDEVVQLYVTDLYASVKTRVMELKDFERINLKAGETKIIFFTLTPYQLSLLNDKMDRVVEPGTFKMMVGGKSPSYRAGDRIKESVGYKSASEGLAGEIDYPKTYAADFAIAYSGIEENLVYNKKRALIKIKNTGNLMDTGKARLFVNGIQSDEMHHYELAPGEEKIINFDLDKNQDVTEMIFVSKYKSLTIK
jgi:beta-glucosidase